MKVFMRNIRVSQKKQVKEFVLEFEEEEKDQSDKNGVQSNEQE